MASRCFGVIPPKAIFGRSLLYFHAQLLPAPALRSWYRTDTASASHSARSIEPLDIGVLLRPPGLRIFNPDTLLASPGA